MYNINTFGQSAAIITPKENNNISTIPINVIKSELAEHGALLFRDFNIELNAYSELVNSLCSKVTLDPARRFVSNSAQLVDAGYDAISLHCENGLTPFIPDILAFMCEIPAIKGSATTYCDGQLVWEKMSGKAKEYFANHSFHFSRIIPKSLWQRYLANELGITEPTGITPEMFQKISATIPQHHFELLENEEIFADLNVKLVHPTLFSDKSAFANSLIGPSVNYQRPTVHDENGHTIPQQFVDEFEKISDALTEEVLWQAHDMLIIDNTRYMHGRRKIEDPQRKIYAAIGYI